MVNYVRLKTNLRVAMQRLKLLEKKKAELATRARKEIGTYLLEGEFCRVVLTIKLVFQSIFYFDNQYVFTAVKT